MHPSAPCSRARGALLGLAAGDALGTTLEFTHPGEFEPLTDMVGGGPFGLQPGQWTDDTSMALCLAESLIACGGFDPHDQMCRYCRWYCEGHLSSTGRCFDIGGTTRQALQRFMCTGDPLSGSTDPRAAGNGSLMRLAPVAIAYWRRRELCIQHARSSSLTTHGAQEAVDACLYFAYLLLLAFEGRPKDEILAGHHRAALGTLAQKIAEIAAGSFKHRQPPQIRGSGYVVKCLEGALWAFYRSDTFRDGALLAVNLGEDADTTGAVYGQIAGAYYGEAGIPIPWRERLARREIIEAFAEGLTLL